MPELAPHQRDAVARALALLGRYGGAILADEVGLGKSFVAASVACRMLVRHIDVELVVPASLVPQWRDTLRDFSIDVRILTHDALAGVPFVPDPDRDRLVIVDEAHAFRNPRTQRYAALARRSIAARLLLVTATPICNAPDDLLSLISLIVADDVLRRRGVASIEDAFAMRDARAIDAIVSELVIRRDRAALPPDLRFGDLDRRVIRHPIPDARTIDELRFPLIGDGTQRALLRRFLWRRLESSEAALLESLRRQVRFYERALDAFASGRALTKRDYRRAFGDDEEADALQQVLFWQMFISPDTECASPPRVDDVRNELARLDTLRRDVENTPREKERLLLDLLTPEPTLIFTSAIATARDLFACLRTAGRAGLLTSRGAQPLDALDAFRRGAIDLLVATDLASEGLNLQRAGVVIHYDIPWNPVKLDQRNGRAHRIGQQRAAVRAIYFLPDRESARSRIVETVAAKNRARRRILGSHARVSEIDDPRLIASRLALPPRLPKDAPALALARALQASGIVPPESVARRYRAGIERLFEEMAHEYVDRRRLNDLEALLECERALGEPEEETHPARRAME